MFGYNTYASTTTRNNFTKVDSVYYRKDYLKKKEPLKSI